MMKNDRCERAIGTALILMVHACATDPATKVEGGAGVETVRGGASSASRAGSSTTYPQASGTTGTGGAGVNSTERPLASGGALEATGGQSVSGGKSATTSTRFTGGASSAGGASTTKVSTADAGRSSQGGATSALANAGGKPTSGGASNIGGSSLARGGSSSTSASSTGGRSSSGGASSVAGSSATSGTASGPCDLYKAGGTPCVAAHSTVRALVGSYSGKLYQVRRADNTTKDIATLTVGGFADGPAQQSFCSGTTCVTTVVYDQTGNGNDLWYQGSSVVPGSPRSSAAKADTELLSVGGHQVYSLYIKPGNSYWRDGSKSGVPTDKAPEGMYMVTSGKHVNDGCCFDYGNSETTRKADAAGAMDAINFSKQCWFGGCSGSGPWVQADLEWGLFPGGSQTWNPKQKAFSSPYVTAMLKNNGTTQFALKGGDAQTGTLSTLYQGALPNGYNPMKKQGAIVLGSGGDCCKPDGGANLSEGTFYEGAIVSGYPTDATEDAVQSDIVGAGYGATSLSAFFADAAPVASP